MNKARTLFALLSLMIALTLLACGQGEPAQDTTTSKPASTSSPSGEDVVYEPAYPDDVSSEGLSEDDVAQQHHHSHDEGEEHVHGEGEEHVHGEGEEHDEHDH